MGHIKEPEGVDFIIKSPPLTEKERQEIIEFIRERKSKKKKTRTLNKNRNKENA